MSGSPNFDMKYLKPFAYLMKCASWSLDVVRALFFTNWKTMPVLVPCNTCCPMMLRWKWARGLE